MALNLNNTELVMTAGLQSQFPTDKLPQIALSGRSNVGKSSLLNKLVGRKSLARVSGSPGKTITINFYRVDKKFYIVDLPGYGFAKRAPADKAKWSKLTDSYFTSGTMTAVAQLIDLKVGPTADDEMMLDFMNQSDIPYIIIATKADKLNVTNRKAALESLRENPLVREGCEIIPFSALDGMGKDEAMRAILALMEDAK
ncbi:MAG: YihA family ribosome biogenesis GTP-binding protein [Clostridia bacterium]|nr:YihA family ribosome biogenesis GTP-binding protein [Clostridia bacterium]